ncbi:MAG: oligosaccharide flippase family protein, partial [Clostridia bacterium]|nr:oligosaccharide flippase family protein [Clostridia bacterium]
MTAKKRFFLNGLLLTAVGLSMRTATLFFNAFVSRTVGAEGMGLFTLIMTVYGFALTFATSGISLTMTRLVAGALGEGEAGRVKKILQAGTLYALAFGTVATVVLFFFSPLIATHAISDARAVSAMRILSASLIPSALLSVFSGYFVGVRRVAKNAVTQVIAQGGKILLTLLVLTRVSGGVEKACAVLSMKMTLTDALACLISYLQLLYDRRREKKNATVNTSLSCEGREVVAMALPLAFSAYIRSALLSLEHMLIPGRLRAGGATQADALASYGILHGMALPLLLYPMAPLSSLEPEQ